MIVSFKHISHIVLVFDLFEQVNADLANMSMDAETKFVYCQKHVAQRCSVKKVFLEILKNSQENTSARVYFLIKLQACNFAKKQTLAQVFSCEFCKISKITFFSEYLWWLLLQCVNLRELCSLFPLTRFVSSQCTHNLFTRDVHIMLCVQYDCLMKSSLFRPATFLKRDSNTRVIL